MKIFLKKTIFAFYITVDQLERNFIVRLCKFIKLIKILKLLKINYPMEG